MPQASLNGHVGRTASSADGPQAGPPLHPLPEAGQWVGSPVWRPAPPKASILAFACLLSYAGYAEVKLPTLLADHMVVQRGVPVHIWGKAEPGEIVSAEFRGASRTAATDPLGVWSIYLPPGDAGGPYDLKIRGGNSIVLHNVLVGDVWVAAGQSNMEWPIRWAAEPQAELARASHPRIRLFRAMHRVSDYPYDDLWGKPWTACSAESAADFSAVGYHFGRYLQERLDVPIGLIQVAWGGTPVDAWTRLGAIASDASLMPSIAAWASLMEHHPAALLQYHQEAKAWERTAARAKAARTRPPEPPGKPEKAEHWKPGAIYNGMVAPLTPYPIKGVIWYQGESNTEPERAPIYGRLFQTMIRDWRRAWGQGEFPFLFTQLSAYRAAPDSMWPEVREAQRKALSVTHTAMAVTIDLGEPDSIHPKNKAEVGRRLSLAARALAYGASLVYSGPLFRQAIREDSSIRVWFDWADGLTAHNGALRGFEVAGADRSFVPAEARIDGVTVVVSSAAVTAPIHVRYAWSDYPACNLYNAAGLPASPFQSE